ncbi:MAG: hypothetical protein FJ088_16355 [Deltaproteobacteria bacterium]|nr:hypothetical protein [Deltaproteobacteria bacterium]
MSDGGAVGSEATVNPDLDPEIADLMADMTPMTVPVVADIETGQVIHGPMTSILSAEPQGPETEPGESSDAGADGKEEEDKTKSEGKSLSPGKESDEKKSRGKRRRSLLSIEEGGLLSEAPVYKRSLLAK